MTTYTACKRCNKTGYVEGKRDERCKGKGVASPKDIFDWELSL